MQKIIFIVLMVLSCIQVSEAQEIIFEHPGHYFSPAYQKGKYGYINSNGEWMISPKYEWCGYFYEGYAAVKDTGKFGFINIKGEWVAPPVYDSVKNFSEGYAAVGYRSNEGRMNWDMIDTLGRYLKFKVPALSNLTSFSSGITIGTEDGFIGFYFLNKKGQQLFEAKEFYLDENNVPGFSEGLLHVHLPDGASTYIDTTGKLWGKGNFEDCGDFHDGMAWFREYDKFGFINANGEKIIAATYDSVGDFSNGIALVKIKMTYSSNTMKLTGGATGYIDREGKPVTPAIFQSGSAFNEGIALVKLNDKFGFIDAEGKTFIDFKYDEALPFMRGLAFVKQDNHWIYINTKGKKVF